MVIEDKEKYQFYDFANIITCLEKEGSDSRVLDHTIVCSVSYFNR